MPAIPTNTKTTEFVMENRMIPVDDIRGYLGLSSIGDPCWRKLWYGFHFVVRPGEPLPIRKSRIFKRGDLEEARVVEELKAVGMRVSKMVAGVREELFGTVGEDQEGLKGFAGHALGHPDGRVLGVIEAPKTEHLLEIKTAKDSTFKKYKKEKSVKKVNANYYGQLQSYMEKMGLTRALFIVTNKDNEERYYERVKFNKEDAADFKRKEQIIVTSLEPLKKVTENKNWFSCKWCEDYQVCHHGAEPDKNCRTCEYSDIEDAGRWSCGKHKVPLSLEEQLQGCGDYEKGWNL